LTRHPEIRIATIAAIFVVCATTSSAAAIATHTSHGHARPQNELRLSAAPYAPAQYSVSLTMPDARASVVASADDVYASSHYDDVHGTTTVVRPRVQIVTQFRSRETLVRLAPEIRLTPSLKPGQRKLVRHGYPALEVLAERVVLWDEVVIDHHTLNARVLRRGRPDVVLEGAPMTWQQFASANHGTRLVRVYDMEATAYTAWTATSSPTGRTATGMQAGYGIVAVDPSVIRLGTHLFVPGYGFAIAADTGGAIVGNRVDLCMESVRDAITFGRRPVKVYVLAP
jgi:3D (Asp-Asp-Asp) domain-containing protein